MASVTPTAVPAFVGDLPDPADKATYGPRGRAVWQYEIGQLHTGMNLLATQTKQNADHAQEMALLCEAFADFKGAWADLTGPLNMPALVSHNGSRWFLLNNLTDVTASEPGVSADWEEEPLPSSELTLFEGGAESGAVFDGSPPDTVFEALLCALAGPNLIDNWEMLNVIRRYGSIPPQNYAAGVFVIDRWKAGADGMTRDYYTHPIDGSVRITLGSMVQTIPMVVATGEKLCLAWDGYAEARINGGPWTTSPLVWAAGSTVTSVSIEFRNSGAGGAQSGTVSRPRLRRGERDLGPGFARSTEDLQVYLARFYSTIQIDRQANMVGGETDRSMVAWSRMITVPVASQIGAAESSVNVSSVAISVSGRSGGIFILTATGVSATRYRAVYALDTGY